MSDPTEDRPIPPLLPAARRRRPRSGADRASRPRRRGVGRPVARFPIIAGVVGLLVAGGLADRSTGQPGPSPVSSSQPVPVAAPAGALSSSWFCAGSTGNDGPAAGRLIIANAGTRAVNALIRLIPSAGAGITRTVTVGPLAAIGVPEALPGHPSWVAAVVDLDGGVAAVSQQVSGPLGQASTPCATSGSTQWYFATGATLVNASQDITLLNPYPTDAVVDMSFTTNEGGEAPADFQGLIVPAGGLLPVDLGSHLRRRRQIATTVRARTGRVVAWSTTLVSPPAAGEAVLGGPPDPTNPTASDPAAPAAGLTLTLGASSTGTAWAWPNGQSGNGLDERYVIYNPSGRAATVTLSLTLDQGVAEPFVLTVGALQVITVASGAQARIPPGVGHTATLRSTNGVGVVAARTLTAVTPATQRGAGSLLGARVASAAWLVPAAAIAGSDAAIALLDPGINPLEVTVFGWQRGLEVPLAGLSSFTLAPEQRSIESITAKDPGYVGPVVVRATGPIDVESDLYGTGATPGISLSTGVPLQ